MNETPCITSSLNLQGISQGTRKKQYLLYAGGELGQRSIDQVLLETGDPTQRQNPGNTVRLKKNRRSPNQVIGTEWSGIYPEFDGGREVVELLSELFPESFSPRWIRGEIDIGGGGDAGLPINGTEELGRKFGCSIGYGESGRAKTTLGLDDLIATELDLGGESLEIRGRRERVGRLRKEGDNLGGPDESGSGSGGTRPCADLRSRRCVHKRQGR